MAEAFLELPCRSAVLDGELVMPDRRGAPDFYGMQAAISSRATDLVYFAFDLLHRDGVDLRRLPLSERKRRLARLVNRAAIRCLHLVQPFDNGLKLLEAAELPELEG